MWQFPMQISSDTCLTRLWLGSTLGKCWRKRLWSQTTQNSSGFLCWCRSRKDFLKPYKKLNVTQVALIPSDFRDMNTNKAPQRRTPSAIHLISMRRNAHSPTFKSLIVLWVLTSNLRTTRSSNSMVPHQLHTPEVCHNFRSQRSRRAWILAWTRSTNNHLNQFMSSTQQKWW